MSTEEKGFKSLTFANFLQLLGMLGMAILFVVSSSHASSDNTEDIKKVNVKVTKIELTDAKQDAEIAQLKFENTNIKGDLIYHTDLLVAIADELKVTLPVRRPVK